VDEQELCYTDIATLGRLYRARTLSPVEATRAVLDRIRRLDQRLNSLSPYWSNRLMSRPGRQRPSYRGVMTAAHYTACRSRSRI
jgi:hypothetical protein